MTYLDEGRVCLAADCPETPVARGRCNRHYMAWYRRERAEWNREAQRRWRTRSDYNAKRRAPQQTRACAVCGAMFRTSSANKLYCLPRCKQIAYRRRNSVRT